MNRKIRIATAGDNCMDTYPDTAYPGGNPVNVAVYIKRLGGEASYIGAVGDDDNGKCMIQALRKKEVDTSHVQVLPGKTAVTYVELIEGDRVLGDYEEGVLADFRLREEDIDFICQHDLMVSGIWGMIERELPRIQPRVPIAFDFANKFAHEIVDLAVPYVTYAFFSMDEESKEDFQKRYEMLGCPKRQTKLEQLEEFMQAVAALGPKHVVVTLGEQGSIAWDGSEFFRCGIEECRVIDTMGAGDSFIAGYLCGILKGMSVSEAMRAGAKNSAVTLGYFGAW